MSKKIHLDSMNKPEGTVWFTLVFENEKQFYVEKCYDTNLAFIKNRLEKIDPTEFGKHSINGVSLAKLVETKLSELPEIKKSGPPMDLVTSLKS
jgi:hypothetical protein